MKILGEAHDNQVLLYDPGCASLNVGDEIISDSARSQLEGIISNKFVVRLSTHQSTSFRYRRYLKDNYLGFVLGSNLLKGNMLFGFRQWDISLLDSMQVNNLVLVGCGWQNYGKGIDFYSKLLYKRVLSCDHIHSVRDEYTKEKMQSLGFRNVLNTGCATMWGFTPDFCDGIPRGKGEVAVATLTDYRSDSENDKAMLDLLFDSYRKVYVWIQGSGDYKYLHDLGYLDKCELIPSTLAAYDRFLSSTESVDYVGTRLHGGIRALQHKKRSIIISIDNRAREMGSDFNLPIVERGELEMLGSMVQSTFGTEIKINESSINEFLGQF